MKQRRFCAGQRWVMGFTGPLCLLLAVSAAVAQVNSPLSPAESLEHLQTDTGLAVELVAAEPDVIDPIAIRFDEDGRLWVVEMRDYPHGPPEGQLPLSQIRVLTDDDGDGRFDHPRIFADHLLFPTGLQPWKGGLIVTLAGQVVYLKDTDGDGRADLHEVWYQGFTQENPQLRANHPRLSLDNRVYVANGLRGGVVHDPRRPQAMPTPISGLDFSFDPLTGDCRAVSGNGQFGLAFNDFGERFVCNNRMPLDHVVLANQDLARNPFLAVPAVIEHVAAHDDQSHVYPRTSAWTTSNLHAGQFTAACGIEIYRGDLLDPSYRGNAFICEPTGSLVHREIVKPSGVSFDSQPAYQGRDFLSSDDPWFRPVNLELGPDGALYVVDMYRAVIEHPQYMPSELQQRPDLRLGDDRGRIYRIVPAGKTRRPAAPSLSKATPAELVALLGHNSAWCRETAARLLLERRDTSAREPLENLARSGSQPTARVHALWALAGLDQLADDLLARALADAHPRVREQAALLAAPRLVASSELTGKIIALAEDPDARVRFRAALVLGGLETDDVNQPLAKIALRDADDVWTRRAVASSLPRHTGPVLRAILRDDGLKQVGYDAPAAQLIGELATVVGSARDAQEIARILALATATEDGLLDVARENAISGLAEGLQRRGAGLVDYVSQLPERGPELVSRLNAVFERATAVAVDAQNGESLRGRKIDLLRQARAPKVSAALVTIVNQDPSQDLRIRAAVALVSHGGEDISAALLEGFSNQTPAVRRAVLDALVTQPASAQRLLDAIEAGRIARAEIDAPREGRLIRHPDNVVQARAKKLLPVAVPAERKAVLADYQKALDLKSDPVAGKPLFRQHCSTCHHIGDLGVDVAPDISDSRVKTAQQLLTDILHPNQAIDNNYVSYTLTTHDGNVHVGIISSETATSVTLRQAENKTVNLLRTDVDTLRSNGVSLMPEGFEKQLSQQQMADLISFIKNWRYLDEPIPGAIKPVVR